MSNEPPNFRIVDIVDIHYSCKICHDCKYLIPPTYLWWKIREMFLIK